LHRYRIRRFSPAVGGSIEQGNHHKPKRRNGQGRLTTPNSGMANDKNRHPSEPSNIVIRHSSFCHSEPIAAARLASLQIDFRQSLDALRQPAFGSTSGYALRRESGQAFRSPEKDGANNLGYAGRQGRGTTDRAARERARDVDCAAEPAPNL
jgi:hypothetical protein